MAHLDMIIEREIFMTDEEKKKNPEYFPKYLIVVKHVQEENKKDDY